MLRFPPTLVAAVLATGLTTGLMAAPAVADEFTDTVEGALEAYRAGDVTGARHDLEYATKLLAAMKAESLAKFLPPALPGWTRTEKAADETGGMMAMLGGGVATGATYARDDGTELTIDLVANSPMVSGIAAMVGGLSSMGGGKPIRIQRVELADTDGELQGVVDRKVLISVSGDAPVADKTAYIETMDLQALADF